MPFVAAYYHYVFSTKERRRFLTPTIRERLFPFLGGIARQYKMKALQIGGVEDHVHVLVSMPPTMSISKAVQLLKGGSSKWLHQTFPECRLLQWQEKYGAFTVSPSQLDKITKYIANQKEHHRQMTFQKEVLALLKKHGIQYDERYMWD